MRVRSGGRRRSGSETGGCPISDSGARDAPQCRSVPRKRHTVDCRRHREHPSPPRARASLCRHRRRTREFRRNKHVAVSDTPTPRHATSSASFRARTRGDADDDARSDARVRPFASRRAVSPRSRPAEEGTRLVSPAESAFASSTSTRRLRARVRQDVVQPRGPGAHAPGGRRGLGGGTPVHVEFNRRRRQDGRSEARGRRAVGPLARGP